MSPGNGHISNRSLPQIANSTPAGGESAMSREAIEEMFAGVLSQQDLLERTRDQINELHFNDTEVDLEAIWLAAASLSANSQRPPTAEMIREVLRNRLATDGMGASFGSEWLQNAIAPSGLLDQLLSPDCNRTPSPDAAPLIKRFLLEREFHRPLVDICRRATINFGGNCESLPSGLDKIVRSASERQQSIEETWGSVPQWAEPLEGPVLPDFPVDALPESIGRWVAAEATATQTPPDLLAMLCLSVCAAAVAKRFEVRVREGWQEPLNIFTVTVLPPGNRKSSVFRDATAPLCLAERVAVERLAPRVREYQSRKRMLEARIKHLEGQAAKNGDADKREQSANEVIQVQEELLRLQRVNEPKFVIDDCTPEKVEVILHEQGGRIACMSPEGGIFTLIKGRYSNRLPEFGCFLKGHAGDDIRVDRISREAVFIEHAAITMGLAVQPEVIRGLGSVAELRHLGLVARYLYSLPASPLGRRQTEAPSVASATTQAYHRIVRRLLSIVEPGRPSTLLRTDYVTLAPDAYLVLMQLMERIEPQLTARGELGGIADWAAKLAGAVVRLAGILHVVRRAEQWDVEQDERQQRRESRLRGEPFTPWDTPIDANTMRAAERIGDYLTAHAHAAYDLMSMATATSATVIADAHRVFEWIQSSGRRTFSRRDAYQKNRTRTSLRRVAELEPVLDILTDKNIIRPAEDERPQRRGGRPPSPVYEVNPRLFETPAATQNGQELTGLTNGAT